jgi:hypothetical protein
MGWYEHSFSTVNAFSESDSESQRRQDLTQAVLQKLADLPLERLSTLLDELSDGETDMDARLVREKGAAQDNAENEMSRLGGRDPEEAKVKQYVEKFREYFPKGTKKEDIVAGFKAEKRHNPRLTAHEYLNIK